MSLTQIFKRIIIPCAAGATHVSNPEGHNYGINCAKNPNAQQGTKPSDLPLYGEDCSVCREIANQTPPPPSGMEETVGNIRRELWVWQDNLRGYRHKIVDVYRRGFSKAECPEGGKRMNPLEKSLEDKCDKPHKTMPRFENLHMNRCGRPCVGDHTYSTQCKHLPVKTLPLCKPCLRKQQEPPPPCPPKEPPCPPKEPPCPPKEPPCPPKEPPPPPPCPPKKPTPPCPPKEPQPPCPPKEPPCPPKEPFDPCAEKRQQQNKPPPSKSSRNENNCLHCHAPECSGRK